MYAYGQSDAREALFPTGGAASVWSYWVERAINLRIRKVSQAAETQHSLNFLTRQPPMPELGSFALVRGIFSRANCAHA